MIKFALALLAATTVVAPAMAEETVKAYEASTIAQAADGTPMKVQGEEVIDVAKDASGTTVEDEVMIDAQPDTEAAPAAESHEGHAH